MKRKYVVKNPAKYAATRRRTNRLTHPWAQHKQPAAPFPEKPKPVSTSRGA